MFILLAAALWLGGCATKPVPSGFLSDYSRLEPTSGGSLRYLNPAKGLGNYSKFIVDPVVVHFHEQSKGAKTDEATRMRLTTFMHDALVKELQDGYEVVSEPGPGIARVRVALTDVDASTPALNILPQTKLTGLGLGGASMEGEIVDSRTGEQIGALIEAQKGKRVSFAGVRKWGDAEAVMKSWAGRLRKRLDDAHSR
jgi:hypothetical protein